MSFLCDCETWVSGSDAHDMFPLHKNVEKIVVSFLDVDICTCQYK